MNRLDLIAGLLGEIGADANMDRILAQSALIVLTRIQVTPPAPEPEPEPEPVEEAPAPDSVEETPKKTKKTRKPFDTGKLGALRRAGWSVAKIADEMGVSEQTVRNHMKKEGIA